ncbi:Multiple resistance and pH homeostasis protein A, partial [Dysosmobacter welbionis]
NRRGSALISDFRLHHAIGQLRNPAVFFYYTRQVLTSSTPGIIDMPVFQCDRKTIEYSGILQFLVRVFSQVLLREIVRCPLPTSALSLLDIQLKGDGHLAKVHVIGSDGLAIAAHPPLGEGGSGLQRVFQLLHVDGVAVCGVLTRCPIAGEVILVPLIQRFLQIGVQLFLHGVHPPGAVGGPLFQLRLGLRGGRRLFGGILGIGVSDLVRIFRRFCRCDRDAAGAAMFPIRRIAVQAGGTEGLLLRGGLAVPVSRLGVRVLVFFPICRRFRTLCIPFVRGRIGGLVSLLRGHFCGRRCLLSLAGARFGGLFRGDAGLFCIRIVRTPDLISPLSGFCILGPLDGVVLALCQLLLDVRVALPLLGSGAAGHSEPDNGDQCTIFPLFIGGIRTQTEGVVKVLPGFLAREGDELCLHSLPAVQERGVGLFPLFMGQQTADSISVPCDVLGLQVARAAPGIVAAQEALVLLHMIEVQRAVGRILLQACKGKNRFNSCAVSSLL